MRPEQKEQQYHEVIRPFKEIGSFVLGWAKDIVVPPESVEWGGAQMLDQQLYEQPQD